MNSFKKFLGCFPLILAQVVTGQTTFILTPRDPVVNEPDAAGVVITTKKSPGSMEIQVFEDNSRRLGTITITVTALLR